MWMVWITMFFLLVSCFPQMPASTYLDSTLTCQPVNGMMQMQPRDFTTTALNPMYMVCTTTSAPGTLRHMRPLHTVPYVLALSQQGYPQTG